MAPFIIATENGKRVRDTSSDLRDTDPLHAISGTALADTGTYLQRILRIAL